MSFVVFVRPPLFADPRAVGQDDRTVRAPAISAIWLLSLAASAACGGPSQPVAARDAVAERRTVSIANALQQPLERAVSVSGTLAAEEQVALSFKVTGRVHQLLVDLGSPVRRGQVLARLTPTDFELRVQQADAALQQARARLGLSAQADDDATVNPEQTALVRQSRAVRDEARLTRDRVKTFVERGISSRADLDAAEALLEVGEGRYQDALEEIRNREAVLAQRRSELALARQALEDTVLRAPIDGAVRERQVTEGEFRSAGTPVLTIVRTDPLRLRLAVPERAAAALRAGQSVRVRVEGDPATYEGKLVRLGAAIEEGNRTLPVEAVVSNRAGALRPGMFAAAEIVIERQDNAIVVPDDAIVTFAGVQKVLLVKEGRAREQRVRTGRRAGGRVEIVEGVKAGDVVIVNPGDVVDGVAVVGKRP
jgi:RND family efflux transporter MFP subunit